MKDSLGFSPRFAIGITPSTGYDQVITVSDNWVIKEFVSGTLSDRSGSITGSSDPRPFTGTILANVLYLNREDRVPVYRTPAALISLIYLTGTVPTGQGF